MVIALGPIAFALPPWSMLFAAPPTPEFTAPLTPWMSACCASGLSVSLLAVLNSAPPSAPSAPIAPPVSMLTPVMAASRSKSCFE